MCAGPRATASSAPALRSEGLSTPGEEASANPTASTHRSNSGLLLLAALGRALLRLLDLFLLGALPFRHDYPFLSFSTSGCSASRPTPNRHRVSLNGAVLCSPWYHTRDAAATPMRLLQPFAHGQAADLHRYSGVRPQPIQSYAGQTLQYGTSAHRPRFRRSD